VGGKEHWRIAKVERECEYCGALFVVQPCFVEKGKGRFCSKGCARQWQWANDSEYRANVIERQSGPNSWFWRGGKSFEPYGIEFNNALKFRIRERDGHACVLCREPAKCVHHIDYDKRNNLPENLITLCWKCHSKTNFNRSYWQSYFTGASHSAIMAAIPRYVPQGA